jgi:hypothetical protein
VREADAVDALLAVRGIRRAGEMRDARMTELEEMIDRHARGGDIVDVDQTRTHAANLLEQNEREVAALELEQVREVRVLVEHRGRDQTIDVLRPEQLDRSPLRLVVAGRAGDEQRVALCVTHGAGAVDDSGVIRVVVLLDEERDAPIRSQLRRALETGSAPKGPVVEQTHGRMHAIARCVLDAGRPVEHRRDGGLGDACLPCDVGHGGPLSGHVPSWRGALRDARNRAGCIC